MIARCDGYDVDTSLVGPATNQRRRLMNRDGADGRERWRPTVAVFGVLLSPSPLSFSSVDGEEEKKNQRCRFSFFSVFFRFRTTRKKERRVPKSIASLNNNNNNKKTSKKKTQIKKSSTDLVDAADAREDAGDLR